MPTTPNDYTDLDVWDDEVGERYFIAGHINRRRSLAAVNRYLRRSLGPDDRRDHVGDYPVPAISVTHHWFRPAPICKGDDETMAYTDPTHPQAEAITVVSL